MTTRAPDSQGTAMFAMNRGNIKRCSVAGMLRGGLKIAPETGSTTSTLKHKGSPFRPTSMFLAHYIASSRPAMERPNRWNHGQRFAH
jgi:hypothetical protein